MNLNLLSEFMFFIKFGFGYQNLFVFLQRISLVEPRYGARGGMQTYYKRLSTLVLDGSKSGSFYITVKDESTVGAFGYDYHVGVCIIVFSNCHIIRREAPRCSFYCDGHMPEPRFVGRVTDTDSHA